jgi:hypothetical protein
VQEQRKIIIARILMSFVKSVSIAAFITCMVLCAMLHGFLGLELKHVLLRDIRGLLLFFLVFALSVPEGFAKARQVKRFKQIEIGRFGPLAASMLSLVALHFSFTFALKWMIFPVGIIAFLVFYSSPAYRLADEIMMRR